MASSAPTITIIGDGELSDSVIESLAALLLSIVEAEDKQEQEQGSEGEARA